MLLPEEKVFYGVLLLAIGLVGISLLGLFHFLHIL